MSTFTSKFSLNDVVYTITDSADIVSHSVTGIFIKTTSTGTNSASATKITYYITGGARDYLEADLYTKDEAKNKVTNILNTKLANTGSL